MTPSMSHTYSPACRLAPVPAPRADGGLADIPPLKAHFFYSSPIPLDDPLSTPTIVGATDPKSHRAPLRPFSPGDNNTLEKAWLAFHSDACRKSHAGARKGHGLAASLSREEEATLEAVVQRLVSKHRTKHAAEGQDAGPITNTPPVLPDSSVPVCCSELLIDASAELRNEFCALTRKVHPLLNQDRVIESVMSQVQDQRSDKDEAQGVPATNFYTGLQNRSRAASSVRGDVNTPVGSLPQAVPPRPPTVDDGISGLPFVRVGNEEPGQFSPPVSVVDILSGAADRRPSSKRDDKAGEKKERKPRPDPNKAEAKPARSVLEKSRAHSVDVPVGVSRLHQVALPVLQMKPIYWSPVNDISIVMRATWFYEDTMLPVEPDVANQLETGYRELRPWSVTWADELRSALHVGPLGEEKVSHPLWPVPIEKKPKARDGPLPEPVISSDPFCAAKCFQGEAAAAGTLEPVRPDAEGDVDGAPDERRPFKDHHVIYKDADLAYLLKPSLKPSAYYGRKPVAKIMKGLTVGIPVVRGFDWHVWEKSHHKGRSQSPGADPATVDGAVPAGASEQDSCPGCVWEQARGQVTDLVLIAHGIGQKFAERVESFHFTHAVNAFRRAVNVELGSGAVKSALRPGQNGIMVLPVNWRHILRFEDGGPMTEEDQAAHSADNFTLKDIEPNTIPAVRSMISDVMFDIPFYMSHHKPKMIAALVAEANRVYRLWCQNNPGFSQNGRVHLIAHSLGSAMALEILSKQPTAVPRLDLSTQLPFTDRFEFDTTNLFLLGSPAGFFLLLERGNLIPRRGRSKPDAEPGELVDPDLVGDVGTFGCLAVDNIYNVLAKEDPIAYLLNGTIDPKYASSLKTAYVPSTATSLFQSIGNAMRGIAGGGSNNSPAAGGGPSSPTAKPNPDRKSLTARLPSQLELEVHDFTREDIAERKAYLLNDNGQVDYYLRSGGGPLEMQYVNMLSAHTSYWYNPDLIRMLCIEIGRKPGRGSTLPGLRAVKSAKRQMPLSRSG